MKLDKVLAKVIPGPVKVEYESGPDLLNLVSDNGAIVAEVYPRDEASVLGSQERIDAAFLAHCRNKFEGLVSAFNRVINGLPEEYDDLHTKNLIETAQAVLEDCREVEGI